MTDRQTLKSTFLQQKLNTRSPFGAMV